MKHENDGTAATSLLDSTDVVESSTLATRSKRHWCCEPEEQSDPDIWRHRQLSPPTQGST